MTSYFLSFLWGICVLLSLIGWGGVINRILFSKYRVDWGQRAAWGIAFSVFGGGVLNVTWLISQTAILIYLGLGLFYWVVELYKTKHLISNSLYKHIGDCRKDQVVFLGTLIVFFLIFVQYAGSVSTSNFNIHDDYHAYLVFPNKMLQMGSMGPDPFSERRIVSSLGGETFLDTFILSVLSEKNLNIIDAGCGLLIAVGLLLGLFQENHLSKKTAIFLIILFLLIELPTVNITSVVMPLALFLSLFRTLDSEKLRGNHFLANGCIIALTTSAICALKSNLIPTCIILLTSSYFFYILSSKLQHKAVYEFFVFTSLVGVFLLPWMISMYQSSGTLLYPLLGKGYHGSVYGTFLLPYSELTLFKAVQIIIRAVTSVDFLVLCLLGFISLGRRHQKLIGREAVISLLLSAGLGTILLALATGGYDVPFHSFSSRYSISFVVAAIFILIAKILVNTAVKNSVNTHSNVIIVIFLAGLLIGSFSAKDMYLARISNIQFGFKNVNLVSKQEVIQSTKMLQAIPEGETILTRLEKPFLLNFRRNRIFIADYPGGASLPPGMPFFKGGEALADYLTSKSIRYVAYSYANEAGFQKKYYKNRLSPEENTWFRTEAQHTFDFQDNLKQLGKTRKRVYDDRKNFVLDLLTREQHQ